MLTASHPYDALMDITARPRTVFVQGQGSWLWDDNGRRYLDFIQGWAVNSLGRLRDRGAIDVLMDHT